MHAIPLDPARCVCLSVGVCLKASLVLWVFQPVSTHDRAIFNSGKNVSACTVENRIHIVRSVCQVELYFEAVAIFIVEKGGMRLIWSPDLLSEVLLQKIIKSPFTQQKYLQ